MLRFGPKAAEQRDHYRLSEWDARTIYTKADRRHSFAVRPGESFVVVQKTLSDRAFVAGVDVVGSTPVMAWLFGVPSKVELQDSAIATFGKLCDAYGVSFDRDGAKLVVDEVVELDGPINRERLNKVFQPRLDEVPIGRTAAVTPLFTEVSETAIRIVLAFAIDDDALQADVSTGRARRVGR